MNQYEDLLVDALLDRGFTVEEAVRLIALQERVDRERCEEDERRRFAQWMEHISRIGAAGNASGASFNSGGEA